MGYLSAMYRLFKDTVSETEKDNIALVKLHMKMCVKHYHALIPQLDLIATQWGVNIEDTLSHNDLGLPRSERKSQRRQGNLEEQLRNKAREPRRRMVGEDTADPVAGPSAGRPQQNGKTSATNSAETPGKFRAQNKGGLRKRRETKVLLPEAEEDLRLLKRQLKSQPALQERQINHPQELRKVPGGSAMSRQDLDVRASPSSMLTKATTTASYISIQLLQVLRKATAFSSAGKFGRRYALLKENPDGQTFRAFHHSLTTQWDVLPQDQGMVREYYRVKESNNGQFLGVRMKYHVWRQRFIATVHSQRRLISDKAKALSTAIDKRKQLMGNRILGRHYDPQTYAFLMAEVGRLYRGAYQEIATKALDLFKGSKIQLSSLKSVRTFRVKLEAYRATLDTYRIREAVFGPNGQLYKEIQERKFTQPDLMRFHDRRSSKGWPEGMEGILEWLDHHQSILEYSQQGSKTSTLFPKDQLRAHDQVDFS
jgi:hypothetical protein